MANTRFYGKYNVVFAIGSVLLFPVGIKFQNLHANYIYALGWSSASFGSSGGKRKLKVKDFFLCGTFSSYASEVASCCSEGENVTRHSMCSMWECRSFVRQLLWHYKSCLKCSHTSLWCLWIEIDKWFLEVLFAGFLPMSRMVCKYWDRAGDGLQRPNQHLWSLTTMHQHARSHLVLRTIQ